MIANDMSPQVDVDEILAFTIKLALEAGEMIRVGQARRFACESAVEATKVNTVDLVTEVDKAVEASILKRISSAYPDHKFMGEETYAGEAITDDPTWIGDPIDGTTNFIHGYPQVATSIGLAVHGVPIVGVVYNPFLDLLYSAAQGRGAYLNNKIPLPITGKPKPLADLGHALISVDITADRSLGGVTSRLNAFKTLAVQPGCGGKMVASGGQDMHWEIGGWPWDVCAGICILTEAGGVTFGGKDSSLSGEVDAERLACRKYVFVRAIAPAEGETTFETQRRFVKEFYDTTGSIEP